MKDKMEIKEIIMVMWSLQANKLQVNQVPSIWEHKAMQQLKDKQKSPLELMMIKMEME